MKERKYAIERILECPTSLITTPKFHCSALHTVKFSEKGVYNITRSEGDPYVSFPFQFDAASPLETRFSDELDEFLPPSLYRPTLYCPVSFRLAATLRCSAKCLPLPDHRGSILHHHLRRVTVFETCLMQRLDLWLILACARAEASDASSDPHLWLGSPLFSVVERTCSRQCPWESEGCASFAKLVDRGSHLCC